MAKTSLISGETSPFVQKLIRQNSPLFLGRVSPVMAKSVWILCGHRCLASIATVQKWPNKKTKKKKTGDGWDSQLFFFPPPPLVWCLLEWMATLSVVNAEYRTESKQHRERGQTPDCRGEELVRRLLYIYSRPLFSSAPFIACFWWRSRLSVPSVGSFLSSFDYLQLLTCR
jgi:hypothetical protein